MSFQQIAYISRSTVPLGYPLDVTDILDQATRNNTIFRITGALAYTDGCFVQVLEGPAASLDGLLPVLATDTRHCDMEILGRIAVHDRTFPAWAMLFPLFTPETASDLSGALAKKRRHMPFYRDLLSRMVREQAARLSDQAGLQRR